MKHMFFLFKKQIAKDTALLILGIILGAVLATLAIGNQIEDVHNKNSYLNVQLNEKEKQIKALEDKVTEAKKWFIVKEIQINLELPPRNFADKDDLAIKIKEDIKGLLENIRGKRVNELDPEVIWHIVDGRQVEALGYNFLIEVKGISVSEKVIFYIFAKYVAPNQQNETAITLPLLLHLPNCG